jgi:hypothetical protein
MPAKRGRRWKLEPAPRSSCRFSRPRRRSPQPSATGIAAVLLRDYTSADVGIEGRAIKGLGQAYRPETRAWLKRRSRTTAEAIVGAVTGTRANQEP